MFTSAYIVSNLYVKPVEKVVVGVVFLKRIPICIGELEMQIGKRGRLSIKLTS